MMPATVRCRPRPRLELPTFWFQDVRGRFGDLAKSIRKCPPATPKRGVEQMLRQRCDTGRYRLLFVA
jgi:hypothetical protein